MTSWERIVNPVNLSNFLTPPSVHVSHVQQNLYQQFIQTRETAEQARHAVEETEAEAERKQTNNVQQQAQATMMGMHNLEVQAERFHERKMAECDAELAQVARDLGL